MFVNTCIRWVIFIRGLKFNYDHVSMNISSGYFLKNLKACMVFWMDVLNEGCRILVTQSDVMVEGWLYFLTFCLLLTGHIVKGVTLHLAISPHPAILVFRKSWKQRRFQSWSFREVGRPTYQGLSVLRDHRRQSRLRLMGEAKVSVGHWSDVLGRLSLRLISSIKMMQKEMRASFN